MLAVIFRRSFVGGSGIDRITELQAEQTAAGLGSRIKISGRQCQAGKTKSVSRIGFLGGNHPAAGPLVAAVAAGKCHRADDAVPIHDAAPHVQIKAAVRRRPGTG